MPSRYKVAQPMRIQARRGSIAEERYYKSSGLPQPFPIPKAIASGVSPMPLEDLIFHGGRIVPQMRFQNVYCGSKADWKESEISSIDSAISTAMQDKRLNNVVVQYFHATQLSCDPIDSIVLEDERPSLMDEPDVQAKIVTLFRSKKLSTSDLGSTIFNLVVPRGSVLSLGDSDSKNGLGGYHGSVHLKQDGSVATLYYSANVYSEGENGITAFDASWKNVVATLYHEMNEFRTDADVKDAIEQNDNDFLGWMSRGGRECGDEPIAVAAKLDAVFQEVLAANEAKIPVQFLYSNAVHGPEGPIGSPR